MSSLREQLQKLTFPQSSTLKSNKTKVSLLFDEKNAAEIPREVFYQIGCDGLEELRQKNNLFDQFAKTLFSITSKDFERSVEDTTMNEILNKHIRKFLVILTPYFLLSSAHKALEWLIHRYSIHEYNKVDLLMLILPYHETNMFIRSLQIIKIKDSDDNFSWLKSLQRSGAHLPKTTLHNHVATNTHLLQHIAKFILQAIKEHDQQPHMLNILFNYYTMTFTGALEYSMCTNEKQITPILNILLKGQKSKILDFCAGSYVITAKLLSKTYLSQKILNKFVDNISRISVNNLRTEAILLLVIVYQMQNHFKDISDEAVENLSSQTWIPKVLLYLKKTNNFMNPFLESLFKGLVRCGLTKTESKNVQDFTTVLINEINLNDSFIPGLLSIILEMYNPKHIYEEADIWIKGIVSTIENQYPTAFQRAVNLVMRPESGQKLNKIQKRFKKLAIAHNMQGENVIFNKIYHPVSSIRKMAVEFYIKNYNKLNQTEQEFVKAGILARLNDEDPDIVLEILNLFKKKMTKVIDLNIFKDVLVKLLKKGHRGNEWFKVSYLSSNILNSIIEDADLTIFIQLLPFLFPLNQSEMKIAKLILPLYIKNCKYFVSLDYELENKSNNDFCNIVAENLKLNKFGIIDLMKIITDVSYNKMDVITKYLTIFLLCMSLPEDCCIDVSLPTLLILTSFTNNSTIDVAADDCSVINHLSMARQDKFPLQGILQCTQLLITKTDFSKYQKFCDLSRDSWENKFNIQLLNFLLTGCYTTTSQACGLYSKILKSFLKRLCSDFNTIIEFLLNITNAQNAMVDISLQLRAAHAVNAFICLKSENIDLYVDLHQIMPHLLNGLSSAHKEIRIFSLDLIDIILTSKILDSNLNYITLLRHISCYRDEIQLHDKQISSILQIFIEKRLSVNVSEYIINSLSSVVNNTNYPLYLRGRLYNILIHTKNFDVYNNISTLALELLEQYKDYEGALDELISGIVYNSVCQLNSDEANKVNISSNVHKMFILLIYNDTAIIKYNNTAITPSVLTITHIDRYIYDNFTNNVKSSVVSHIIEIATRSCNSDVLIAANKLLKHIDLNAEFVLKQINEMLEVQSPTMDITKRKRRVNVIPTVDILETMEWRKGLIVLECLQNKKKIANVELLITQLFKILKKCLDFDEQSYVEYSKQLILSTILNCCRKLETSEKHFDVELIIQCIRASQNPQTHHHALLLLSYTTNLIPKKVLHHIMAIFTFMGSSVLRHDDAYSFQIINKIIDTIIPILVEDNSLGNIVSVIRVFVDAILDVPEHRRMKLYKHLLDKIDVKNNLYLFLLLMLEAYVLHANDEKQKHKTVSQKKPNDVTPKRLDIAAAICRNFPPHVVIENCTKLIKYLQMLPENKDDLSDRIDLPFNITHQTPKQFRHFKYVTEIFICNLLSSNEFVSTIAALDKEEQHDLELLYKNMIISSITYIQTIVKISDKNKNTPQAQYWKVMLYHSYDILDSINALLTPEMFLLVIRGLTKHNLNPIRRRSLELFNSKLQHNSGFFRNCSKSEKILMIPVLLDIIKNGNVVNAEEEIIIQTALLSLKLLIKLLPDNCDEYFIQVLDFLTGMVKSKKLKDNILASTFLCLSELCSYLRSHAVSYLSRFMPVIIKILKIRGHQDYPDLLLLSAITAIHKILECLSLFLSPYLEEILNEICGMVTRQCNLSGDRVQPFIIKLMHVKEKICDLIPSRVLIPAIANSYNYLIEKRNYHGIKYLMDILAGKLHKLQSSEIQDNLPDLTVFFLSVLDFRSDNVTSFTETNEIEHHIISALIPLILKLSETSFRPFYYKIYEWAVRHNIKNERVITFYCLTNSIATNLKSLFVIFASHFLTNVAAILDLCNITKQQKMYFEDLEKTTLLLEYALKTLYTLCLHDTHKFINRERFNILMQPLVDQLENALDSEDALVVRAETLIIPCIVQLSVVSEDDFLWKQLNYHVLLKMRNQSSNIKIIALNCVLQLAKKFREDFLPLLPETIPFLAELLEDCDNNVEKACQRCVQELEEVLGEPLQKYF